MTRWSNLYTRFHSGYTPVPFTDCLIWTRSGVPQGYGVINKDGRQEYAHRIAWEFENGPIPDGMMICHKCDVPGCVNPNHLFLGSAFDNAQDMKNKGRARGGAPTGDKNAVRRNPWIVRGENSGSAKITKENVSEIFRLYENGMIQKDIAAKFNLAQSHISRILRKAAWHYE